jgi:hypothetical protein
MGFQALSTVSSSFIHPRSLQQSLSKNKSFFLPAQTLAFVSKQLVKRVRLGAALVIFAVRSLPKGEAEKADVLKTNPVPKTKVEV